MWGSNGLRLRRGFSAGVRYARAERWYSWSNSLSTQAVSETEFSEALGRIASWRQWSVKGPSQIGLAISGGVDSMALAALYQRNWRKNCELPIPHGIIIDHKMRPESGEEAQWVASQLKQKFDMESSIVPLVWPEEPHLDIRASFETDARRLRYQALGVTCRDLGIRNLLVAHHGDDQAETIMIRLIKGRWRSGLVGMSSDEWIPECYGIHGVHHSGLGGRALDEKSPQPFPIEHGGIRLLRPLLSFEKSRLIATCQELDVSWAEDRTNKDPTLTGRNAVRHVFQNHKLPEALDKRSLISLSEHMQERAQSHRNAAESVFNQTLIKLDIQTGSLHVRFPPTAKLLGRPVKDEADRIEARNTAFLFIQRVIELISPKESRSIGQLSIAVDSIYPILRGPDDDPSSAESFTVSGVLIRPWGKATVFAPQGTLAHRHEMDYYLCRQPLDDREKREGGIFLTVPPASQDQDSQGSDRWRFFDGRYWIQVRNRTDNELVIRTLNTDDLNQLSLSPKGKHPGLPNRNRFMQVALQSVKPAERRKTIPAIFRKGRDGVESLLALPTFGVGVVDADVPLKDVCHWNVRYKKIELPTEYTVEQLVSPGLDKRELFREAAKLERGQSWKVGKARPGGRGTKKYSKQGLSREGDVL